MTRATTSTAGLVIALAIGVFAASPGAQPQALAILFRDATVIDGTGAAPRRATSVLTEGDRIVAVGPKLEPPPGAEIVDLSGAFIIPGLIDCHAHLDAPMVFQITPDERDRIIEHNGRAFLYNGVTTVLNLSSDADWIWQRRADERAGRVTAPRIYATGRSFTPEGGWGSRHGGALTDAAGARARAREYVAKGADGFKVVIEDGLGGSGTYKVIGDDMLRAIAEEAERARQPIYVHAINLEEFRRALAIRPRAIVHALEDPLPPGDVLAAEMARRNIYLVPTLSLFEAFTSFDGHPERFDDPVLQGSVPRFLLDRMRRPEYMAVEKQRFQEVARMDVYPWARKAVPIFKSNVKKMKDAGVGIAVGTDAGGPVGYNFQGYNTPREIELLVDAGFTPMEAIVAATRTGAEVIGVERELGTIEAGKRADLLVLEADPLADIRHVRRIRLVVQGGRVHRRDAFAAR